MKSILSILVIIFISLSLLVLNRPAKGRGMKTETRYPDEATLGNRVAEALSPVIRKSGIPDVVKQGDIPSGNLSNALNDAVRRKDTEGALQIVRKIMDEKRRDPYSDYSMKEELSSYHDD